MIITGFIIYKKQNMKDNIKIKRHDTLLLLSARIGGSFGSADNIFAGHPSDEERAKEFRKMAFDNEITLDEMLNINISYLYNTDLKVNFRLSA